MCCETARFRKAAGVPRRKRVSSGVVHARCALYAKRAHSVTRSPAVRLFTLAWYHASLENECAGVS